MTSLNGSIPGIPRLTTIGELRPMLKGFDLECIVLEVATQPQVTRDKHVIYSFLVADRTGSIVLSIWGDMGRMIKSGDILRLQGGEAKVYKGSLQLALTKFGKLKRIGEDVMLFSEQPNMSLYDWGLEASNKPGPPMMAKRAPVRYHDQ
ncbi:nucleic acid-binding protein [Basidiobolus meristosporus CBS 931.73]|uniref:Nucleic acid-binding protein n=1 Tax=Basidiobolus meristosporus CBS 931.73 TaxID=1314790 RepID=A0A1Y1Z5D8_9FUNG|nr:nucleic acid-binding protein [Basidiobolus meristosporus CBS 931.73]|eukprot:ORY05334.1 nucleic acid-binding protein [Basidiobolus meristosporus CBS 931.73]